MAITAIVLIVVAAGVALNFSSLRTPNDGVYYVAAAQALVETGAHVDATVVPYGLPITRQNGIVYVLAAMMGIAGPAWPVLYVLAVAMLWAAAIIVMARFYRELRRGVAADPWTRREAWVLAGLTCLHYDLWNDSTSFMNEGIYVPVFFALAAETGRRLIGVRTRAEATAALGGMSRWAGMTGLVFLLAGLFFRNQHVVLLALIAAAGLSLRNHRLLALAAPAAVAAFAAYVAWLPAPVTDAYLATVTSAESFELADAAYALAIVTGPLSLTKMLPYDHPLTVVTALVMAVATIAGLRQTWRRDRVLSGALALYLAGTAVFLVMLPFAYTRYYALANLPLIAAWSMLLPTRAASARWLAVPVAVIAMVCVLYVRSYFSGEKREQAYPQLVAHQRAALLIGDALVYSSQPRMVAWVLGVPACGAPPDACAAARGVEAGTPAVFIGRKDELEGQHGLHDYVLTRALTETSDGYAAWLVARATQ